MAGTAAGPPGPGPGPAELIRAATIARRYYLDGRSKSAIAAEFGISRFKVARLLDSARASGLVRIQITLPAGLDAELSAELGAAYRLTRAVVVTDPDDGEDALRQGLGQGAADLLTELVTEGEILGVAWGRTLSAMSARLSGLARCTVVQLVGVLDSDRMIESAVEMVRRVAAVSGGPAYPLYAPLLVSDAATAEMLRREPAVANSLRRHDQLTTAVVAIGSWDPPNSSLYDALSNVDRQALRRRGVQAEFCARLVDAAGRLVRTDLDDRLIAIGADQLAQVPHVIAVAGGRTKWRAVEATLRGGLVDSLVTDAATARYLLGRV
jgi:DNA-binding transcriptional regulator LsrR (DeoR family)